MPIIYHNIWNIWQIFTHHNFVFCSKIKHCNVGVSGCQILLSFQSDSHWQNTDGSCKNAMGVMRPLCMFHIIFQWVQAQHMRAQSQAQRAAGLWHGRTAAAALPIWTEYIPIMYRLCTDYIPILYRLYTHYYPEEYKQIPRNFMISHILSKPRILNLGP